VLIYQLPNNHKRSAKRQVRHNKSSSSAGGNRKPTPASALVYKGPIWTPADQLQQDLIEVSLYYTGTLSSNAGGVINSVFDQTMTYLQLWGDYYAAYDEFRVLGVELEYFPSNRYDRLTVTTTPGVSVVDRDSNNALSGITGSFIYSSARVMSLDDPWTDNHDYRGSSVPSIKWRMDGVNDATWITTANPIPTTKPTIKLFFSGLSASTAYGLVLTRYRVQFRGRA
jgi:hypothetical protein